MLDGHIKKKLSIKKQTQEMQGYVNMMTLLLSDLMNLAMLRSNTFTQVKDYFDCIKLVRRCFKSLKMQRKLKGVRFQGPNFEKPLDRFYFQAIFGDENRYRQFITNFLTNAVKFTPRNGIVSVLMRITDAQPILQEGSAGKMKNFCDKESDSPRSVPDKEIIINSIRSEQAEQLITFEMIFRDTGCGISHEN